MFKTRKINLKILFFSLLGLTSVVVLIAATWPSVRTTRAKKMAPERRLEDIPFNGTQAFSYLEALCKIGPRPTGSPGMVLQQNMLEKHFKACAAEVIFQRFHYAHPQTQQPIPCVNMIIRWKPERKERLLLCAHYDTLPLALLDPPQNRGVFLGAEDNASGVALLMELGKNIPSILENDQLKYGVDIVLFDAEEFMFQPRGRFCVGSEYFARYYATQPRKFRYRWGILLDMIAQNELILYKERQSATWSDTRGLVSDIWNLAEKLGVREFKPQFTRGEIEDDHVMLHNIGKIPCIDIIDLDYVHWHTSQDTPDKCSPLNLARVGWVISEWVKCVK